MCVCLFEIVGAINEIQSVTDALGLKSQNEATNVCNKLAVVPQETCLFHFHLLIDLLLINTVAV